MTSNAISRRLKMLESAIRPYTPPPKPPLTFPLISFHVGHWQPHESIVEGLARGLGYLKPMEFQNALQNDLEGFNVRYLAALDRMFAAEGIIDARNCPLEEFRGALIRLVEAAENGGMRLPELC